MNNSDLFSAFASQILAALHESFPIPIGLPKSRIIGELENHAELWDLKRKVSTVESGTELLEAAGQMTSELREMAQQKKSELGSKIQGKEQRIRQMESVFDGTVAFLVSEGFIRSDENGTYQLTLKGFTHLNKRFEQGTIQDGATLVERLLDALRPEKFSGSVTTGALAAMVAKVFGG